MDLIDLNDDTILLIGSHLEANDLLHLALSCRHFGAKLDRYQHSLMEEVAMRQVTKNATQQQIECIPRNYGQSWIELCSNPGEVLYWKLLNQFGAEGDRSLLMEQMASGDLSLGITPHFYGIDDVNAAVLPLCELWVLVMEGDEEGLSGGYYWPRTRDILMSEKMTRDTLETLEQGYHIHNGVASWKLFDWLTSTSGTYGFQEYTGNVRVLISCFTGKKLRFADDDRKCTLTLPHGAVVELSEDAEELLEKQSPPYTVKDSNAKDSIIPRTDTNEPVEALLIVLDVSLRGTDTGAVVGP